MTASHIAQGLRLLKNPNVNRMFLAYLISHTGTAMAPIAMAFGVLELTGSAADAGVVVAAPTAATILVLLLGGVVADRTSRQRVMVAAELTAMTAQCTIAWLFLSDSATVPLLTLCMVVNGVAVASGAGVGSLWTHGGQHRKAGRVNPTTVKRRYMIEHFVDRPLRDSAVVGLQLCYRFDSLHDMNSAIAELITALDHLFAAPVLRAGYRAGREARPLLPSTDWNNRFAFVILPPFRAARRAGHQALQTNA